MPTGTEPDAISTSTVAIEPDAAWSVAASAFRAWLDGERMGIDRLVAAMNPVLWNVVRAYRVDEAATRDVIQETWTRFLRGYGSIDDPQAVSAWLTTTARREAWRVARRAGLDIPSSDEVLDSTLGPQPSAEDAAVTRMDDAALWRSVLTLSERCQRLLRIIAFESRPDYRRIAGDLGMPVGSIGPTRSRCLAKLRSALVGA